MALLSSCQQKEDKNMTSEELMRKAIVQPAKNWVHSICPAARYILRVSLVLCARAQSYERSAKLTFHKTISMPSRKSFLCYLNKNYGSFHFFLKIFLVFIENTYLCSIEIQTNGFTSPQTPLVPP